MNLSLRVYKVKELLFTGEIIKETCVNKEEYCKKAYLGKIEKKDNLLFNNVYKYLISHNNYDIDSIKNVMENIFIILDFNELKDSDYKVLDNIKNGFSICYDYKEITYKLFIKSNSMSKKCQMIYIDEKYYDDLYKRVSFNLDNKKIEVAKWYSYSGLLLSDAYVLEDIKLNRENILIVKDKNITIKHDIISAISIPFIKDLIAAYKNDNTHEEACMKINSLYLANIEEENEELIDIKNVIAMLQNGEDINKINEFLKKYSNFNDQLAPWYKIKLKDYPVNVNLFDGEGFISFELRDKIVKSLYKKKVKNLDKLELNSFQIRMPYIKGVCHSIDLVSIFNEFKITKLMDISGKTYDVKNILMLLTESQIKALKFTEDLDGFFANIKKYDYSLAISGFEPYQNKIESLNYQFLSTMPISSSLFNKNNLLRTTKDYINHCISDEEIIHDFKENDYFNDYLAIYNLDSDFFLGTKAYNDLKEDRFNNLKKNAIKGEIFLSGRRKYLSGDLLELLYFVLGIEYKEYITESSIYINDIDEANIYSIFRSPHYNNNEIGLMNRFKSPLYDKYFSHLKGVVMINPKSLLHIRLGGADFDGDTVLCITDQLINTILKNNLNKEVIFIPSLRSNKTPNTYKSQINAIKNTFSSRIGLISNIAFEKTTKKENTEIYTILAGIEIDSAKNGKKPFIDYNSRDYKKPSFLVLKDSNCQEFNIALKKYLEFDDSTLIYSIVSNLNNFKGNSIFHKKIKLSSEPKSVNGLIDVLSIVLAYQALNKANKAYLRKEEFYTQSKRIIINKIESKLNNNDIFNNLKEVINKVSLSRIDLGFIKYFGKCKYHYLTSDSEKKDFLVSFELLNKIVDQSVFMNFKNDNYELLYLTLYYNHLFLNQYLVISENGENLLTYEDDFNKKLFPVSYEKYFKRFKDEELNEAFIRSLGLIREFNEKYNLEDIYINDLNENKLNKLLTDYLGKKAFNINCEDVISLIDLSVETTFCFKIFSKQVIEFLRGKYGRK